MADQFAQARNMVRAEFEAWAKQAGWPHYAANADGTHFCSSASWEPWQAATQRQQERIAYVEKVADDAIELGNQQAKRIAELEAQVQALSEARQPPPPMTNEEIFRIGDKHMMGCSSGDLICAVRETELRFGVQPPQCDRCRECPGFCDRYECHGLNIDAAKEAT